jgi:mannose-6-phosphate isomerase-like protein (cupin superfamily)
LLNFLKTTVCELELSPEASLSLPLKLQVREYYLLSEGRVLLTRGREKVAVIRKGYETARYLVFRWELGGTKKLQ